MAEKTEIKKVDRTTLGLREALFDEIDGMRNGTSHPQKASAVCKAANAIIGTVKLELDYSRFLSAASDRQAPATRRLPVVTLSA